MQMMQFLDMSSQANCKTAVLPVVFQDSLSFNGDGSGDGDGSSTVVTTVASGAPAYYGGQVVNRGCADLQVVLQYLQGDDCDPCTTPDTLTASPITVVVPANASFPLPDGFWSSMTVATVNAAGAPTALTGTQAQGVNVYSAYTPACPSCRVLAP